MEAPGRGATRRGGARNALVLLDGEQLCRRGDRVIERTLPRASSKYTRTRSTPCVHLKPAAHTAAARPLVSSGAGLAHPRVTSRTRRPLEPLP